MSSGSAAVPHRPERLQISLLGSTEFRPRPMPTTYQCFFATTLNKGVADRRATSKVQPAIFQQNVYDH